MVGAQPQTRLVYYERMEARPLEFIPGAFRPHNVAEIPDVEILAGPGEQGFWLPIKLLAIKLLAINLLAINVGTSRSPGFLKLRLGGLGLRPPTTTAPVTPEADRGPAEPSCTAFGVMAEFVSGGCKTKLGSEAVLDEVVGDDARAGTALLDFAWGRGVLDPLVGIRLRAYLFPTPTRYSRSKSALSSARREGRLPAKRHHL